MAVDTVTLYQHYQNFSENLKPLRFEALALGKRNQERAIQGIQRTYRLRCAAIKLLGGSGFSKKLLYAQAKAALKSNIGKVRQEHGKEKQEIYKNFQRTSWADWLKAEALKGNGEALSALRAREDRETLMHSINSKSNTVSGASQADKIALHTVTKNIDNITKKGTVVYPDGLRDDGKLLRVSGRVNDQGLAAALRLAMERYGSTITAGGSPEFKARLVRTAVVHKLPINFAEPIMERCRQELMNKELNHDRQPPRQSGNERGGIAGGRPGRTEPGATREFSGGAIGRPSGRPSGGTTSTSNPRLNPRSPGHLPPPHARHGLRTVSQLDMAGIGGRGEMLLPNNVSSRVDKLTPKFIDPLRRPIYNPGVTITATKSPIEQEKTQKLTNISTPQKGKSR